VFRKDFLTTGYALTSTHARDFSQLGSVLPYYKGFTELTEFIGGTGLFTASKDNYVSLALDIKFLFPGLRADDLWFNLWLRLFLLFSCQSVAPILLVVQIQS
jgi:hypothetical protein